MKLDSDLWRARFALRIVAGLSAAVSAWLFYDGHWPQGLVCGLLWLLNAGMATNITVQQRTRDEIRAFSRALSEAAAGKF